MDTPTKRPGRRPGEHKRYPAQHAVRFTDAAFQAVRKLAQRWQVSDAEVVRRAVEELTRREGVE